MGRNKEFDDALDELKMLHDAKNHDYATEENPYKNLEGVTRIGIEPWRGIVIRLMDKFERVEQFCRSGEFAIKSESLEDSFKDIAIYSTLAMILFRKDQEKQQELTELERGKCSTDYGEPRFQSPKHSLFGTPHEEGEICKICPSCGQENKNGIELGTARENECYECGYKYYHGEALAKHKYEEKAEEQRRDDIQLAEHLGRAKNN